MDNAQSPELRTYLVGQIARACVIFNCDEIVIYDEYAISETFDDNQIRKDKRTRSIAQMTKILQYLECPQYLRKHLFPIHEDLQYAGLLNPLDTPHHLKESDKSKFREGIVTEHALGEKEGCYVNVGLKKEALISQTLTPGIRVTVELFSDSMSKKRLKGKTVSPDAPRARHGIYWGYQVRVATSFSSIFSRCPYESGYDLTIGTSERGDDIDSVINTVPTDYKHCLIVFGGLKGIEAAVDADEAYTKTDDLRKIFNYYVNTCPNQGSNTIRTEEAILITLSALRSRLPSLNLNNLQGLSPQEPPG